MKMLEILDLRTPLKSIADHPANLNRYIIKGSIDAMPPPSQQRAV
jgi:hypothetical protein